LQDPDYPKTVGDLSIEVEKAADSHRLRLRGELDLRSASKLTRAITSLCSEGARHVALDVGKLEFIDSMGLHAILGSRAICEENLCGFTVTPGQEEVRTQVGRVLEVTGLIGRLPFFRSAREGRRAGG
jgi:anti-sigma B factor antagonist